MATKSKKITSVTIRENKGRDMSPKWDDVANMTTDQFLRRFRNSMDWYRLESTGKDLKPKVILWMSQNGYTKEQIAEFKATRDSRCNTTIGGIAANLLKGMPDTFEGFNEGRSSVAWLKTSISRVIEDGRRDTDDEEDTTEVKTTAPVVNIQERLREAAFKMTEEIEDALDIFSRTPDDFDPKAFKVINMLKGKEAKAAHARVIRDFYSPTLAELEEVPGTDCEQLKEGYSHLSKTALKKITQFYQEIIGACEMLMQEAKVNKKPRAKKAQPKEKIVAKLKYMKSFEQLKLVSINPVDIVGAQELWVYNTKTRKIGRYVAEDMGGALSIKGTSIVGYNDIKSIQKTIRKPDEKINEFKAAGKVALRKFLDDINAVDTKLNGRINEDIILLKVQ